MRQKLLTIPNEWCKARQSIVLVAMNLVARSNLRYSQQDVLGHSASPGAARVDTATQALERGPAATGRAYIAITFEESTP
jgi:hypothetical protein